MTVSRSGRKWPLRDRQHHPGLILLDLHLPDMDGAPVLARPRRDPATAHAPVVALPADATPGQAQRLLDAGADAYLTKPPGVRQVISRADDALRSAAADPVS
jgi:CheY-like chemotaxis protein